MGLNVRQWLLSKLSTGEQQVSAKDITAEELLGTASETYVREIAFWSCVNTIANAVGKCEFKTFDHGRETRGEEYYLWKVTQPG